MKHVVLMALPMLLVASCAAPTNHAVGTLERDRITLPAPVSERIAHVAVRPGQAVASGEVVLVLEPERTRAHLAGAHAEVARLRAVVDEARAGPRRENIAEARAKLEGSKSVALNARQQFERTDAIVEQQLLPRAELDRARAELETADANVRGAREALALLDNGTRAERIVQAESALAAASARAQAMQVDLARTRITAPRAGIVESLPFKTGDQVPVGTPLAILLVGERAYARVYIPQQQRASVHRGSRARVHMQGSDRVLDGHVRMIRSEPSFTPYYALAGEDASRLSWLAEIEIDAKADELPIGVPVRAEFTGPAP